MRISSGEVLRGSAAGTLVAGVKRVADFTVVSAMDKGDWGVTDAEENAQMMGLGSQAEFGLTVARVLVVWRAGEDGVWPWFRQSWGRGCSARSAS